MSPPGRARYSDNPGDLRGGFEAVEAECGWCFAQQVRGWDADPLAERLPPSALCRGRCRGPGEPVVLATPTSDLAQDNFCFYTET